MPDGADTLKDVDPVTLVVSEPVDADVEPEAPGSEVDSDTSAEANADVDVDATDDCDREVEDSCSSTSDEVSFASPPATRDPLVLVLLDVVLLLLLVKVEDVLVAPVKFVQLV